MGGETRIGKGTLPMGPSAAQEIRREAGFELRDVDVEPVIEVKFFRLSPFEDPHNFHLVSDLYLPGEGRDFVTIGRGGCDLKPVLADGSSDQGVSGEHGLVRITESEKGFYVEYEDHSSNGSYLNDVIPIGGLKPSGPEGMSAKVTEKIPFNQFSFISFGGNIYEPLEGEDSNTIRPRMFKVFYEISKHGYEIGLNRCIPDLASY